MMGWITLLLTACGGFLLAVLWMDLIFDSQILAHRHSEELPDCVLASIAAYYHRAATTSRPMSALIVVVMTTLLAALAFRAAFGDDPAWLLVVAAALAGAPIVLALTRTVPNAVRLGKRGDSTAVQTRLARAIYTDHVLCFVLMLAFLGLVFLL